MFKILINMGAF